MLENQVSGPINGERVRAVSENMVVTLRYRRIRLFVGYITVERGQADSETKAKKKKNYRAHRAPSNYKYSPPYLSARTES
jgi:hypothetical protein